MGHGILNGSHSCPRGNGAGRSFPLLLISSLFCMIMLSAQSLPAQDATVHHDLKVTLHPDERRLVAIDTVTLPNDFPSEVTFTLHAGLNPSSPTPVVRIMKQSDTQGAVSLEQFKVILPPDLHSFTISYGGRIYHPIEKIGREQARGFQNTPGLISKDGVYLSAASSWYPDLGPGLVTFDLEVTLPPAWDVVSQGERTRHDRGGNMAFVGWRSPEPQDSIFIIAAPFKEYTKPAGGFLAMVFLRTPEDDLANKYLDATAGYIEMYSRLIGPYPYKKFALVENFWETGFGMPSFTLLGPKVVRLPFIINTSYPHEILHNWWGNSVFADYEKGNWSEGLTAYLSDHLMKEQQGAGADYRVNTLQKYADYVVGSKDFPLTRFRSRHSSSSEAVGYGKSLMFFHMLRRQLGDEPFKLGLREFYRKNKFRFAAFDDLRTSFETVSGKDLGAAFDQWVTRAGAPRLKVGKSAVTAEEDGFLLTAVLEQTQPEDAYRLQVPVVVTLEGQELAFQTTVDMQDKKSELKLRLSARPLRLDIDPEFDLFRRLDREEIPTAISQALGSKKMLIILPSSANNKLLKAYRGLAASLSMSGSDQVEVKLDSDIKALPADRTITILGWENRFLKEMTSALSGYDVTIQKQSFRVDKTDIPKRNHSIVLTARHARNSDAAMMFIASDLAEALPGLAQKLPHYHKYSYLAFEGQEPMNVAKGRWPVTDSPLTIFLPLTKGTVTRVEMGKLLPREPLETLTPLFSKDKMIGVVRFLSSNELGGRGFGSGGLDKAADYIAQQFKEAGLAPAGDPGGSWFQTWEDISSDPLHSAVMKNVVGVVLGKKPEMGTESVVVGAHYDHLGFGWPESRDNGKGKIHPGADDNASGVAVLVELARVLAKGPRPERTIVFVAFTGEEAGKRGSKYYVATEKRWPVDQCLGMVNLDTVGRLGKKRLLVLGTGSAREWAHIFRGAGYVTGVEIESAAVELDSSDQKSFQEAGVPGVQLFSGPHLDYHRTTDTADKIDPDGLVKVAAVAKEAVAYLAGRQEPLTQRGKPARASSTSAEIGRKVSLGTIPDFSYSGKGFRLSGVVPGSPAETAGLKDGDVITAINSTALTSLKDFSNILKTLDPGDKIAITFLRDGKEMAAEAIVQNK